jgi:beta-phosphoglucomutase-like phosphatase (HAD superfamily)
MVRRLSGQVQKMPGSLEFSRLISQLNIPQALVSASPRVIVDAVLSGMTEKYFETSVASGDIERTKPFPDPYLHAAKLLEVDISKCLIFEDSPTGLTAAKASGAFVVAIPHYVEVAQEPRLKVVKSFSDLSLDDLELWAKINLHELGRSL